MIEFVTAHYQSIIDIVAYVIAIASAVAALTPTPKDDSVVAKVSGVFKKVVDFLALNIGNAKK